MPITVESLMNAVLHRHSCGHQVAEIMAAALMAVDAGAAVRRVLRADGRTLFVDGKPFELKAGGRVIVVGAGKAGGPMAQATAEALAELSPSGLIIVKEGHLPESGKYFGAIELVEARHPVPDERGLNAAEQIAALLDHATQDDLVLALISGGGSSLLTLPASETTLADVQSSTELLLGCGATIGEMNTIRKHCTLLSGGGMARLSAPAQVIALIISDVVGSPLEVIASGPTAPDPTTFADAWRVVERYGLQEQLPSRIIAHFHRGLEGMELETVKPDDAIWQRVHNFVIASNRIAAEAAVEAARERGFTAELLTTFLEGEAREVGRVAAAIGHEMQARANSEGPLLLVLGGETTVTLRGAGWGGRNQELALGAVESVAGLDGLVLVTLATDGGDGPTDAAGAVVTGDTLARSAAMGFVPGDFLRRSDSYNFFAPLGALLKPGPTLTNVNDLLFIIAIPESRSLDDD